MSRDIICEHQQPTEFAHKYICAIGLYGGNPFKIHCAECVAKNQNNTNHLNTLTKLSEQSHPSDKPQISGCCDPII